MARVWCLILTLLLQACSSPTQDISDAAFNVEKAAIEIDKAAGQIATNAIESKAKFIEYGDNEGVGQQENIINMADGIREKTEDVRKEAETVISNIPGVEDKKTALDKIFENLQLFLIFGIITGVIVLVVYLGIGKLTRPVFRAAGLVPKKVAQRAEMHEKALEGKVSVREIVAAERAADPNYEAARRRLGK